MSGLASSPQPPTVHPPTPGPPPTTSGQSGKIKVGLRPLDTGRPEDYGGWRYAAKVEIVGAGPDTTKMMRYLGEIEDSTTWPDAVLQNRVAADPELRTLDAKLFSAVLACIGGARQAAVEERVRAQAPFAAGALSLRCLGAIFRKGKENRAHAPTKELLNLQPAGRGPEAFGQFFTRRRLLAQQAGDGVGTYARTEVLQRVAQHHPQLAIA